MYWNDVSHISKISKHQIRKFNICSFSRSNFSKIGKEIWWVIIAKSLNTKGKIQYSIFAPFSRPHFKLGLNLRNLLEIIEKSKCYTKPEISCALIFLKIQPNQKSDFKNAETEAVKCVYSWLWCPITVNFVHNFWFCQVDHCWNGQCCSLY